MAADVRGRVGFIRWVSTSPPLHGTIACLAADPPISSLVFAELYEAGDAQFVTRLLATHGNFKPLLGLIERWKKDARPGARRLKIAFIESKLLDADHRVIFKRLFKQAWADHDHELMACFSVVLDRFVRRVRAKRYRFSPGVVETVEVLRSPRIRLTSIFSAPTTHYLRRRAWRYFRRLGFREPSAYIGTVSLALIRYTDDDVRAGENLLDNWSLMHALFGKSATLAFNARHTNIATRMADLQPAPMFEKLWAAAGGSRQLLEVLLHANCRPVRIWAIGLLKRHHASALASIDPEQLLRLLDHDDADVAGFAAELLNESNAVAGFPMATWMHLLATRNPAVVATITNAFRKYVQFDRVTIAQAVELATRVAVPVATVGLEILSARPIRSAADRTSIALLAGARCPAVAGAISAYAIPVLNQAGVYRVDEVAAFFDSTLLAMRTAAFVALAAQSPAATDPAFWARLFESPYDDVRAALIKQLAERGMLPGASGDALDSLWRTVLLNIHRGGRAKLTALRQISDRVSQDPASAGRLLPVLAIALRSVRPPEARHGLAAIVSAVERVPSLAAQVATQLPELGLGLAGASR